MASASAQLIDDIEVRAVGSRAEVTIKLAAQIRLVRNAVSANGKTLEVFQITQSDEAVARIVEEARKVAPELTRRALYGQLFTAESNWYSSLGRGV